MEFMSKNVVINGVQITQHIHTVQKLSIRAFLYFLLA